MSKKFFVLFIGAFFIPFAGNTVKYECYDPIRKKIVGNFGGLGKLTAQQIASKCRTESPYCRTGKCTLPPKNLKKK